MIQPSTSVRVPARPGAATTAGARTALVMRYSMSTTRPNDLTPEEDVIADPEDIDDEIDDTLPADLRF
jgi:hypothetical protein